MDALDIYASANNYLTGGNTYDLTVPGSLVTVPPSVAGTSSGQPIYTPKPYVESNTVAHSTTVFQGVAGILNSLADIYAKVKYSPRPVYVPPGTVPGQNPSLPPNYISVGGAGQTTLQNPLIVIGAVVLIAFLLFRHSR